MSRIQKSLRDQLPGLEWVRASESGLWIKSDNGLTIALLGNDVDAWLASLQRQSISYEELLFNLGVALPDSATLAEYEACVRKALNLIAELG